MAWRFSPRSPATCCSAASPISSWSSAPPPSASASLLATMPAPAYRSHSSPWASPCSGLPGPAGCRSGPALRSNEAYAMNRILIRSWTRDDVGVVLNFVRALAAYEREPDAVSATEADLLRDGFGPKPCFEVRLAFLDDRPAGFTLFFTTYSTWEGRPGLYLEDIFIEEWAR